MAGCSRPLESAIGSTHLQQFEHVSLLLRCLLARGEGPPAARRGRKLRRRYRGAGAAACSRVSCSHAPARTDPVVTNKTPLHSNTTSRYKSMLNSGQRVVKERQAGGRQAWLQKKQGGSAAVFHAACAPPGSGVPNPPTAAEAAAAGGDATERIQAHPTGHDDRDIQNRLCMGHCCITPHSVVKTNCGRHCWVFCRNCVLAVSVCLVFSVMSTGRRQASGLLTSTAALM